MNVSNRIIGIIILYLVTAFICIGFLAKKIENRETAEICYQAGINLEKMEKLKEAKEAYLKAYKLNPTNLAYQKKISSPEKRLTYLKHSGTLLEQKKYKEAIKYCQEGIEEFQDSEILIERMVVACLHSRLAQIYEEKGEKDLTMKHQMIYEEMRKEKPHFRRIHMTLMMSPIISTTLITGTGLLIVVLGIILGLTRLSKKGKRFLSIESKFRPKEIAFVVILIVLPFFVFLSPFFPKYETKLPIGFLFPLWLLIISSLVYFPRKRKEKGIFPFLKELLFLSFIILPFWIVVFMFYSTIGSSFIIQTCLKYY